MKRREFIKGAGLGAMALHGGPAPAQAAPRRVLMKLGTQQASPTDDMLRAMRVCKEVGYDGMKMPDPAPRTVGDDAGRQAFAFAFGYIRALIQAVDAEA